MLMADGLFHHLLVIEMDANWKSENKSHLPRPAAKGHEQQVSSEI